MKKDVSEATGSGKCRVHPRALLALVLPLALSLAGCLGTGGNAVSPLSIDQVTTSSVSPLSAESEIMSDEAVVRDLAGSLAPPDLAGLHPWSNALTGSAGVITGVVSVSLASRPCRQFQTTRHGFDGVSMFDGKICQRPDGSWDLVVFEPING